MSDIATLLTNAEEKLATLQQQQTALVQRRDDLARSVNSLDVELSAVRDRIIAVSAAVSALRIASGGTELPNTLPDGTFK